ncbi:MAG: Rpn family recombination-promoting nuclease/putative transposase [Candidatus Midichloria sp.]|nr:Rpn family recombination-promoting nuclease/putative transposase [Candidatus Midichloria sp.]
MKKESFIEDDLNRKYSDIIYSLGTKDNKEAFVYVYLQDQIKRRNEW